MNKKDVAAVLEELGVMSEIIGENPFKSRSYYNGARKLETSDVDLKALAREGKLQTIPGIGQAISQKIRDILNTGTCPLYERLREEIPEGVFDFLKIPGLGPKKAGKLFRKLGCESLDDLQERIASGQLIKERGFGKKTVEKIEKGIDFIRTHRGKKLLFAALREGEKWEKFFEASSVIEKVHRSGEIRRIREVVSSLDFLLETKNPDGALLEVANLIDWREKPVPRDFYWQGETEEGTILRFSFPQPKKVGAHQLLMTGGEEHLQKLRNLARTKGWNLTEEGLLSGDHVLAARTEEAIYRRLGLEWIPPEIREGQGEIEAGREGNLPHLVCREDLIAVLHNHTTWSDGRQSLEEMALAARERGFQFISINDHSQSASYAGGLSPQELEEQIREIDEINKKLNGIQILKGTEVDILPDGSLDFSEELLAQLDYVVASVHSHFKMSIEDMTQRVIQAIQSPHVHALGHPTGRLLLQREPFSLNIEEVLEACGETSTAVEINANPRRLDLDWRHIKKARDMGLDLVIGPDAHSTENLDFVDLGVMMARKGWLEAENLVNITLGQQAEDG